MCSKLLDVVMPIEEECAGSWHAAALFPGLVATCVQTFLPMQLFVLSSLGTVGQ